ncbi:uncharacterized protein LOC121402205 [Xenopus laevis]|uniref:Uncharacterized protein LOC121402205 n=1 Tax=Xenopus laevis TaxID=8355 RepID=A0A8J1MT45_XENLA|nr:uncharacterized protein LOC121402205 [Xenopus laevis]
MKIAAVFLLVALSSCFDSSTALVNTDLVSCLKTLLVKNTPDLIKELQRLLCLYKQGKDENNEALYRQFLKELDSLLQTAGCSLDQILGTKDVLETTTDKVGDVASDVAQKLLEAVDFLQVLGTVLNTVCDLTKKPLGSVSDILGISLPSLTGSLGF